MTGIEHLKLDHNELESLGGSLIGIKTLVKLNISHNKFTDLSPYDLTGLNLKTLDVSHNLLHILPDSSQVKIIRWTVTTNGVYNDTITTTVLDVL